MIIFHRDLGEKQYTSNGYGFPPPFTPRKGWKKGQKYTTHTGEVCIVDSVDVNKKNGELRLHVTRIK